MKEQEKVSLILDYTDLTKDEVLIREVLLCARNIEEYLFEESSLINQSFSKDIWVDIFQKRVNKIKEIDINNPSYRVELKKRIVQQAALSIKALVALHNNK